VNCKHVVLKALLFGVLFISTGVAAEIFIKTPDSNPEASVVMVEFTGGHGSGVYIGNGTVITAAHVIKGAGEGGVALSTPSGGKIPGHVEWSSEADDVAVITFYEGVRLKGLAPAKLACSEPDVAVGDELEVIGNPLSLLNVHTWGRVAAPVQDRMLGIKGVQRNFIADLTVAPGNSGGPAFTTRHTIAGIVVALMSFPMNMANIALIPLTYIIPKSVVCGLIQKRT
jgi:S1-C subfamily serine protease